MEAIILENLLSTIKLQLAQYDTIYLAYSGGLDSHVLLHLLTQYPEHRNQITAVHINHGWSEFADDWEQHCRAVCEQWQINFLSYRLNIKPTPQQSLEAAAREARYAMFKDLLNNPRECVCVAHQQNDQAETLLLQLFRGAGIDGLAAMPVLKSLGAGKIYRPLLHITREQLQNYAVQHGLKWLEDESNRCLRFERNWLRHQILPLIQQRQPGIINNIARSARLCGQAQGVLNQFISTQLTDIQDNQQRLLIDKLQRLSLHEQAMLLRNWFKQLNFKLPNNAKLKKIIDEVIGAPLDAQAQVSWGIWQVRKYRNYLYALEKSNIALLETIVWHQFPEPLRLPHNLGILTAKPLNIVPITKIEIRWRGSRGTEKIKLANRGQQHHRLKKLLQEWGIPPWQRGTIPLIYVNDELMVVAGFAHSQAAIAQGLEVHYELST